MAPSEEAPIAERALVKPNVVLLAEVNVKQAVFLEKWFLGSPVFDSADGRPLPAAQERTLLGHLRAANVDPRRDIDQLFYALYPADDAGLRQAIVLLGRFDPAAVGDYLARELHGIRRAVAGRDVYEITTRDLTTCAPSSTWMVTVDPKWILVADAGSHAALLPRLTGVPDDAGPALGWWRPLARADVLGLAVWDPSQLGSATTQPILKASADAVAAATNGFRRVYLGLGVKPVPPQGRLRFVIDAQDATRVSQQLAAFRHALDESRARWAETMPTVAALYASLQARSEGGQTTIEFTVDRTLAANLQQLVSELVAAAFGGLGLHRATPDSGPPAEQLDPHGGRERAPRRTEHRHPAVRGDVHGLQGGGGQRLLSDRRRYGPRPPLPGRQQQRSAARVARGILGTFPVRGRYLGREGLRRRGRPRRGGVRGRDADAGVSLHADQDVPGGKAGQHVP